MTIPVEAGDILVAGNLLALHADAVLEHLHRGLAGLRQVPDPRRAVAGAAGEQVLLGVPGADEDLAVVTLHSSGSGSIRGRGLKALFTLSTVLFSVGISVVPSTSMGSLLPGPPSTAVTLGLSILPPGSALMGPWIYSNLNDCKTTQCADKLCQAN